MSTNNLSSLPSLTIEQFWQVYQEDVRQRQVEARQRLEETRLLQEEVRLFHEKARLLQEEARQRQEEEARQRQEEARQRQEEARQRQEEARQRQEEARQRQEEARQRQEEEARQRQEEARQRQEEARQRQEEVRQRQEEWQDFLNQKKENEKERQRDAKQLAEQMRKTDIQLGKLGNRFGEMVEHLVAPGIAELFNKIGYHFHGVYSGELKFKDENGNLLTEVDILLENDESIIAVEVKAKPCTEDILYHIERLKILQQYFKKHRETEKKIIGAVAGAIFTENVKKAVIKKGLYVIAQSGDTIKIDVPEDFQPTLF